MMEEVKVEFCTEDFKPPQDYVVVGRPKIGGTRYYFVRREVDGEESFHLFPGGTSLLKRVFGKEDSLVEWMANYPGGFIAAKDYSMLRADYGSAMHGMVSEMLKAGEMDDKEFSDTFRWILGSYDRSHMYDEWIDQAKRDMASWLTWANDYNVEPIFSELPLVSFKHGVAGQLDFLCWMDEEPYETTAKRRLESCIKSLKAGLLASKPSAARLSTTISLLLVALHDSGVKSLEGQDEAVISIAPESAPYMDKARGKYEKAIASRKRILAMPDWKFGNSISYKSYDRQLGLYYALLKENYPELEVKRFYNWRPTAWTKSPGYEFKEKFFTAKEIRAILDLWAEDPMSEPWMPTMMTGPYGIGSVPTMEKMTGLDYYTRQYKAKRDDQDQ